VAAPHQAGHRLGRFKGVRTARPQRGAVCIPIARPVIVAVRLWQGKIADGRDAPRFVREKLATAAETGCIGLRILCADPQFHSAVRGQ
jgi:hypothetical protein